MARFRQPPPPRQTPPTKLVFKSNRAFFEYQCKFCQTDILQSRPIVAMVVDAAAEYGLASGVRREDDGSQTVVIDVASKDGGFRTIASTAVATGADVKAGDLVAWVPLKHMPRPMYSDSRSAWVGLIVAVLAPEFDDNGPKVIRRF